MKVVITGANGFLGSHLVEQSVAAGYETIALLRPGADLSNLEAISGYQTVEVNYRDTASLTKLLQSIGPIDLFIHNAGLTKSYTLDRYLQVNVNLTKQLLDLIKANNLLSKEGNFAYVSSLAAKGPVGNGGPASNYGISKLKAEKEVKVSGLPYMIYRPTGIYGSRDVQFVPLIKAVKLGLYPSMTSNDHKMTLINARDAARNILQTARQHHNKTVHLEDGHVYTHADLKRTVETALDKKSINLKVAKPLVRALLGFSDIIDRTFKRTPKLSLEHYNEISQNWDYDFSEEREEVPLDIELPLDKGFDEAITYYQSKNLL